MVASFANGACGRLSTPEEGVTLDDHVTDAAAEHDSSDAMQDAESAVDAADADFEFCGDIICAFGLVCCNPVLGLCTEPGEVCIQ